MEQEPLFHEDIYAATSHVVAAMGGNKVVGHMLWPSQSPENAGRKLANCINTDRPENLKPEELMMIFKRARERGVHSGMNYFCNGCGYEARPIEPEDEKARLQREYIEAAKVMAVIAERIERCGQAGLVPSSTEGGQ